MTHNSVKILKPLKCTLENGSMCLHFFNAINFFKHETYLLMEKIAIMLLSQKASLKNITYDSIYVCLCGYISTYCPGRDIDTTYILFYSQSS